MSNTITTFLEICKNIYEEIKDMNNIKRICSSNGINISWDGPLLSFRRIIFTVNKNEGRKDLIYYYCNGLIIDKNWNPIVIPPMLFNKKKKITEKDSNIIDNIDKYDILKVIDGTIVSIYWYKETQKWCISSSRGYEVSFYYMIGELTYSEIIFDLLTKFAPKAIKNCKISIDINKRLHFDNLDKNYCYTIGFRHHNFHPLLEDPETIWSVQKVELSTFKIIYGESIPGIPGQKQETIKNFDEIFNNNKKIMEIVTKKSTDFNYGYILRSRNPEVTTVDSSILIESDLLIDIRRYIYNNIKCNYRNINHLNRFEFIGLRAVLEKMHKEQIYILYPNIIEIIKKYTTLIPKIVECILLILREEKYGHIDKKIILISKILINEINKFESININKEYVKSILEDYITDSKYVSIYIDTFGDYQPNDVPIIPRYIN